MMNGVRSGWQQLFTKLTRGRSVPQWISRYGAIWLAIFLSLAIAAFFLGRNLFDISVPVDGDVRSHIFKIELLHSYLANFSWPQWNPYWYHGIPFDPFYPPGFYFLAAALSFLVDVVVAYKILFLITLMLNGIAIFYFSRRFLGFDSHLAMWCLVAYETSTPLLINFLYGEGPNLLGWSATIGFLTVYLSRIMEDRTAGIRNKILPGVLLGVAILVHPFPVIFAALVLAVFHIIWLAHKRSWKIFLHTQLPYLVIVAAVGAFIGMYYWLPAVLTLNHSSPIYSFVRYMWPGGIIYLLAIIILGLAVAAATRYKIRGDVQFDLIIASLCAAAALGFGGTVYLPFGLGSLVQEFRFATIVIPFFGILVILYPLKYKLFNFNMGKLAFALAAGLFITALVFGLNKREAFIEGFKEISDPGLSSLYALLSRQFAGDFPGFAVAMLPYFAVILFLAFSLVRNTVREIPRARPVFVLAGGACLLIMTSFLPYINTDRSTGLYRIHEYVDNYTKQEYAQIMESVTGGRLIVPPSRGYLTEGDNPVTFAGRWGIETVNGPYNQGDPKFFNITVHMEWEERFLNRRYTRENLMQESAAKYIFIREGFPPLSNRVGLRTVIDNSYGSLLELTQDVAYANQVTPILIDVDNAREATEFFNILLPEGYRIVLTHVNDVPPDVTDKFEYIMVDQEAKIGRYSGKTVFLLADSDSPSITEEPGIVRINMPYLTYSNTIFYHGNEADGMEWYRWDNSIKSRINSLAQVNLNKMADMMSRYLDEFDYTPVDYKTADTRIELGNSPGFTLVKNSYFPYWKADGGSVMPTSQGFMLVYSDQNNTHLNYRKPLYYIIAAAFTVLGLITAAVSLLIIFFRRSSKDSGARPG
jgi:hypothetical protein